MNNKDLINPSPYAHGLIESLHGHLGGLQTTEARMRYKQVDIRVGRRGDMRHKNKNKKTTICSSNKHCWPKLIKVDIIKIENLRILDQGCKTKVVVLVVLARVEENVTLNK